MIKHLFTHLKTLNHIGVSIFIAYKAFINKFVPIWSFCNYYSNYSINQHTFFRLAQYSVQYNTRPHEQKYIMGNNNN